VADVTISALTPGTPSSTASIPFTDGNITKKVAPGLLLADAGNVGIGTVSPTQKLDVVGAIASDYLTVRQQNNLGEGGEIQLQGSPGYGNIQIDNFYGNCRVFSLGTGKQLQVLGGGIYAEGPITATRLNVPGTVLQVVFNTASTAVGHDSNYANVISNSITTKGVSSKILVTINQHVFTDQDTGYGFRIVRDSSVIYTAVNAGAAGLSRVGGSTNTQIYNFVTFQYLDTGATAQNQTYTYYGQGCRNEGSRGCTSNPGSNRTSTITLMEIAG
jgi:hypothetical protein